MSVGRNRKEASKRLGIAIHQRYEKLILATNEDEITVATVDLAQVMYENVEFVIWALKKHGGLNPPPPEEIKRITPMKPTNDLPKMPSVLAGDLQPAVGVVECTCPVLEHGIIGRDKHMTSCPQYEPA